MRVLAEIPTRPSPDLRAGTLRRGDLDAYGRLLAELAESRAVLVTGGEPDGQDVALGLATAAAASGTRTVLLECELAHPRLAESLGLAVAPGLHEYLRGTVEAAQILKPVVLAGPGSAAAGEPLVCVVAGRPAVDPEALLGSERFLHATASLRDAYELLVIRGPSPADGEAPLVAVAAAADAVIAAVGHAEPAPSLPVALTGVVVRG